MSGNQVGYTVKKAVFITTKNLDYLRNTQEINELKKDYEVTVIGYQDKSYLLRVLKVYLSILLMSFRDVDLVFIGFASQLVLPVWKWKFGRAKVSIDFFISVYDTMVFDRKKVKPTSMAAKIMKKIDEITLKNADCIICDTKTHGQYFVDDLGADPAKLKVLYLDADCNIYYPRVVKKPDEYHDKFVVLYFGSVIPLQGVEVLLKAVQSFSNTDDIIFEIIGPVPEQQKVEGDYVYYHPWLSQNELAEHIAYADLCLGGHFSGDIMKAKRCIAGKTYIYRAMNKPVILGENAANHELFEENHQDIFFVEMGNAEALAKVIRYAKQQIQKNK